MSNFMEFWNAWAHLFRSIPNGDPYIAAFGLVFIAVMIIKMAKSAYDYV